MVSHLVFGAPATILLCLLTFTAYTRARREEAAATAVGHIEELHS